VGPGRALAAGAHAVQQDVDGPVVGLLLGLLGLGDEPPRAVVAERTQQVLLARIPPVES